MNQDSYNSNSLSFDQPQPPQSPVIHQPPQELSIQEMEDLKQQYLDKLKRLSNLEYREPFRLAQMATKGNLGRLLPHARGLEFKPRRGGFPSGEKKEWGLSPKAKVRVLHTAQLDATEKLLQLEQWAYLSTHPTKRLNSFCYDDDDYYTSAITPNEPVLSTEEPDNSLSMGDEHLDTIPATELDEFIKSSVENLISIPSESEGIPEHMCDVPFHENSLPLDVSNDQFEDLSESN
nr:hypothetical protein [Tanacetum cinerariifolium]